MPGTDAELDELDQLLRAATSAELSMSAGAERQEVLAPLIARRHALEAAIRRRQPADDADVDHMAGCPGFRPRRRFVDNRTNGQEVWQLWCPQCRAQAVFFDGVRQEPASAPAPAAQEPLPPRVDDARQRRVDLLVRLYRRTRKRHPLEPRITERLMAEVDPRAVSAETIRSRLRRADVTLAEVQRLAEG